MRAYLLVELAVPRHEANWRALHAFYALLGWHTWSDLEDEYLVYVQPIRGKMPVVAYWLTENHTVRGSFTAAAHVTNGESVLATHFDYGLQNSHFLTSTSPVETVLVIQDRSALESLWCGSSHVLESSPLTTDFATYRRRYPRCAGFRFHDPFGHRIRVTTDPGYEI